MAKEIFLTDHNSDPTGCEQKVAPILKHWL